MNHCSLNNQSNHVLMTLFDFDTYLCCHAAAELWRSSSLRDVISVNWRAGVFMPCVFKLWRAVWLMKSVMSYIWGETVAWRVFGLLTLILTVSYFSSQFCCRDVFRAAVMSDFNFIKALIASYDIIWRAYHSL